MKKSLLILGMAAAVLSSCSNEETTDVAPQRAINFQSFVNNNTKAATTVTTAPRFYVFGKAGSTPAPSEATGAAIDFNTQLFNNELDNAVYFWEANKTYAFGAYLNGTNNSKIQNATFDASNKQLTFPTYEVNDANDLVAATASAETTSTTGNSAVNITFKHMLSQVLFTFDANIGNTQNTIKITDLKVNGTTVADGSFTAEKIVWTNAQNTTGYTYASEHEFKQIIKEDGSNSDVFSTEARLVIPQEIDIEFTATLYSNSVKQASATYKTTAKIALKAGNIYNLTAAINPGMIIDPAGNSQKIEFDATVTDWENANKSTTTPITLKGTKVTE